MPCWPAFREEHSVDRTRSVQLEARAGCSPRFPAVTWNLRAALSDIDQTRRDLGHIYWWSNAVSTLGTALS